MIIQTNVIGLEFPNPKFLERHVQLKDDHPNLKIQPKKTENPLKF